MSSGHDSGLTENMSDITIISEFLFSVHIIINFPNSYFFLVENMQHSEKKFKQ